MPDEAWSYTTGQRGLSRITIYERYPGGPLQVVTYPNGRRLRQSMTNIDGSPIYDRDFAVAMAERMREAMEGSRRSERARTLLGLPERHTLAELLDTWHRKRGKRWTESNRRTQEGLRRFWLRKLGAKTDLLSIRAADVEDVAAREAERRDWSPRTEGKHLKYMIGAFRFAQLKLKWIGEKHNLSAVEVPTPDSQSLPYTASQARAILAELPGVDLRAGVAGVLAAITLRRINAILNVGVGTWTREGDFGVLTFHRAHDKARKTGKVFVVGAAVGMVEALLETPAVQSTGLLFPDGDLSDPEPRGPVSYDVAHGWLLEAEERAGVAHVKGRAWHGFKRVAATEAEKAMGHLRGAGQQGGTNPLTLKRIYTQADPEEAQATAKALAERFGLV